MKSLDLNINGPIKINFQVADSYSRVCMKSLFNFTFMYTSVNFFFLNFQFHFHVYVSKLFFSEKLQTGFSQMKQIFKLFFSHYNNLIRQLHINGILGNISATIAWKQG